MLLTRNGEPRHSGVSKGARVGASALGVIVALGIGAAVGRATAPDSSMTAPAQTADDSEPPEAAGPGPSRTVEGVPLGFEQSREGAVAAATSFAVVLDSPAVLDEARRAKVLDLVATDEARTELLERFERVAGLLEERLDLDAAAISDPAFVMRSVPAGYDVVAYSDETATVAIWGTSVFVAAGRQAVAPAWGTTMLELRWENGDWRVDALDTTEGPTPPLPGNAENAAQVGAQINRFEPLWYQPARELGR